LTPAWGGPVCTRRAYSSNIEEDERAKAEKNYPGPLQALCRARLADFNVPKENRIVSALPKDATGKIVRREVAALFIPPENQEEHRGKTWPNQPAPMDSIL
jgi:acyl-CoA synthetase (AMP-forming)/AMP-acid ligase II